MANHTSLDDQLKAMKPIAQNMAICCAIDLLGDDAVEFVAEPFRSRALEIIRYRKTRRMNPYGPNREANDA